MTVQRNEIFAGGRFVKAHATSTIALTNPTTEQPIGSVPDSDAYDVDVATTAAKAALPAWRDLPATTRAEHLLALADAFEARADEMARLVTTQNGSPWWFSSRTNGQGPVALYRAAAEAARGLEVEEVRDAPGGRTLIRREPIGVVGIIVPWNAPQGLLTARLAPALASGCTVVAKPSPETTLADYLLAEIIMEAGLPPGVVNIVPGGRETGAALVRHRGTDKICFVGSTAAGRDVAAACGQALKPVNAELGGKSAAIVLDDADLDDLSAAIVPQCLPNSGQVCFSLTRVLAPASRFDEVTELIRSTLESSSVGDPSDETTLFGPLVTDRQRERVEGYIASGLSEGARTILGGGRPSDLASGYFVEPTVFVDVTPAMRIFQEEIFGPVLVVMSYQDEKQAIELANATEYGLSGAVFGSDIDRATDVARQMDTGRVLVNAVGATRLMAGYKNSGLGRENGVEGVASYQIVKGISQPA